MSKWIIENSTLTDIANAIRAKRGTVAPIQVDDLADEIALINGGGSETLLRDKLIIPDKYNTGCHGTLTKFNPSTDTSGLVWRDNGPTLDFNNGKAVKNLNDNQIILFENYDFTDYNEFYFSNVQSYSTSSTYYKNNLKFIFVNCLFTRVRQDYAFNNAVNIGIEFYNCTTNRFKVGNALIDRCLVGNITFYQSLNPSYYPDGDTINPRGPMTLKNSYVMDVEGNLSSASAGHIDGFQVLSDGVDGLHIFNCRFECFDMPYAMSQGEWSYSMFWQGEAVNSSMQYCILHGGGFYGTNIRKASNQTLINNLISGEYHCAENAPESEWAGKACYPSNELYQMSDNWADYIRTLLVSSVWVENGKLKICYSNDMHSTRTLRIVGDNGQTTNITVPACPIRSTAAAEGVSRWSDLPFDLVAEIPVTNLNTVNIYDGNTLIRTYAIDTAGSITDLGTKNITSNGTYNAINDGVDGYSSVTVAVPSSASGTITINQNGTGIDVSSYAYADVQVAGPSGAISINQNGTYDVSNYASALVAVSSGGGYPYIDVQDVLISSDTENIQFQLNANKGTFIAMFIYDIDRYSGGTYYMKDEFIVLAPTDHTTITKFGGTMGYNGSYVFNSTGGAGAISFDETTGIMTIGARASNYPWKAGKTYRAIFIYDGITEQ